MVKDTACPMCNKKVANGEPLFVDFDQAAVVKAAAQPKQHYWEKEQSCTLVLNKNTVLNVKPARTKIVQTAKLTSMASPDDDEPMETSGDESDNEEKKSPEAKLEEEADESSNYVVITNLKK